MTPSSILLTSQVMAHPWTVAGVFQQAFPILDPASQTRLALLQEAEVLVREVNIAGYEYRGPLMDLLHNLGLPLDPSDKTGFDTLLKEDLRKSGDDKRHEAKALMEVGAHLAAIPQEVLEAIRTTGFSFSSVRFSDDVSLVVPRIRAVLDSARESEASRFVRQKIQIFRKIPQDADHPTWGIPLEAFDQQIEALRKLMKLVEIMIKNADSKEEGYEWKSAGIWLYYFLRPLTHNQKLERLKGFFINPEVARNLLNAVYDALRLNEKEKAWEEIAAYDADIFDDKGIGQLTEKHRLNYLEAMLLRNLQKIQLRRRPYQMPQKRFGGGGGGGGSDESGSG